MHINGTEINFHEFLRSQQKILPGCTADLADSSCSKSRCGNHGHCEYRHGSGIQCACDENYAGMLLTNNWLRWSYPLFCYKTFFLNKYFTPTYYYIEFGWKAEIPIWSYDCSHLSNEYFCLEN